MSSHSIILGGDCISLLGILCARTVTSHSPCMRRSVTKVVMHLAYKLRLYRIPVILTFDLDADMEEFKTSNWLKKNCIFLDLGEQETWVKDAAPLPVPPAPIPDEHYTMTDEIRAGIASRRERALKLRAERLKSSFAACRCQAAGRGGRSILTHVSMTRN